VCGLKSFLINHPKKDIKEIKARDEEGKVQFVKWVVQNRENVKEERKKAVGVRETKNVSN
jgi:hypothetical protein